MKFQVLALRAYQKLTGGGEHGYEKTPHYDFLLKDLEKGYFYLWCVYQEYGDCYSGWCGSTRGLSCLEKINDKFGSRTHVPNKDIFLEIDDNSGEYNITDNIVQIDEDGGDQYYPSGYVYVNLDYFTPTNRNSFDKNIVYIVRGSSNSGKSFFFQKFVKDLVVEELDNMVDVDLSEKHFEKANCFITSGNIQNLNLDYDRSKYDVVFIDFSRSC